MSVRKIDRNESTVEFIRVARELEKFTLQQIIKEGKERQIPKSYRLIYGDRIMEHASMVNEFVIRGNDIFPREDTIEERLRFFHMAIEELNLLEEKITIVSEVLPLKNSSIETWVKLITEERRLLKNRIARDRKRQVEH